MAQLSAGAACLLKTIAAALRPRAVCDSAYPGDALTILLNYGFHSLLQVGCVRR
jgi:hypothetical protein